MSHNKHEELKKEYMTFTRTLQETEQALARANTVCHTQCSGVTHMMYIHVHVLSLSSSVYQVDMLCFALICIM